MERFQNNIQKWVELDNKSKTLNEEIRACRNQKNELADDSIMMEAQPFDPSQTILANQVDNPYASFNLEDVQLQSEEEEKELMD